MSTMSTNPNRGTLRALHPVLPVRNVTAAVAFYQKLGFALLFQDAPQDPRYAGVGRDDVELHLQWHDPAEFDRRVEKINLRLLVENIDALFAEFKPLNLFHDRTALRDTTWGTREFAFYDPDNNGLTFYRDL